MAKLYHFRPVRRSPPPWWRHEQRWRQVAARGARRREAMPWWSGLGIAAFAFVLSAIAGSTLLGGDIGAFVGPAASAIDNEHARFTLCHESNADSCVIDGDTFRYHGRTVRIADIDTPEVRDFSCASEKARGDAATRRLATLMNAGPFTLERYERDVDQYGRLLRLVTRDGDSIGMMLVAEGHARPWNGARRPWC